MGYPYEDDVEDDYVEDEDFSFSDFDISEEIVEDFSYYYKDEEDILANERLKRRHRWFSVLIIMGLVFSAVMIIGGIRMATYQTTEVVTKTFIAKQEFLETTEDIYFYCLDFYNSADGTGFYQDAIKDEARRETISNEVSNHMNAVVQLEVPVPNTDMNFTNYQSYKASLVETLELASNLLIEGTTSTINEYTATISNLADLYRVVAGLE